MSDDLDLGEAADYILSERPGLTEDAVWAVLTELGEPPLPGQAHRTWYVGAGGTVDDVDGTLDGAEA